MLKDLFRSKGLKQKWLADQLGVSEVTVSNWVKQKATPNEEHLRKLSEVLNISLDRLKLFYGKS